MQLSLLRGCWEVALLGLWYCLGEPMGSSSPPEHFSARGVSSRPHKPRNPSPGNSTDV